MRNLPVQTPPAPKWPGPELGLQAENG
ncbi:hypothetical protein [Hymenobacter sp. 5516J-16]